MTTKLKYYCTFDPNTGKRTGSYVDSISSIPSGAIEVTESDFFTYTTNPYARYDWDKKSITIGDPTEELSLETMVSMAVDKINKATQETITKGFTVDIQGKNLTLDCDMYDQLAYEQDYIMYLQDNTYTSNVSAYIGGNPVKHTVTVTGDDIKKVWTAYKSHVSSCVRKGREKKEYVKNSSRTISEIKSYLSTL